MPRPKGSQNKITSEVKDKLQLLMDDLIASLNVNELDANQRIKMLQIALQYTLPRLQAMVIKDDVKDLPLFLWYVFEIRYFRFLLYWTILKPALLKSYLFFYCLLHFYQAALKSLF